MTSAGVRSLPRVPLVFLTVVSFRDSGIGHSAGVSLYVSAALSHSVSAVLGTHTKQQPQASEKPSTICSAQSSQPWEEFLFSEI